jgi:arylsulfatase
MNGRLLSFAVILGLAVVAHESALGASPPNIVLILADDMGFSDLHCYGGEIRTPNLDRLAGEGMMFTQFYNNAKCTTTRASLLSGMYPRQAGKFIPANHPTIAETLRAAGYRTALSGKWHLGSRPPQRPIDRGFDEFYGLMDGAVNYFNPAKRDPEFEGGRIRTFAHNDRPVREFPPGYYTTDAFTDHAIATIRQFVRESKPFFLHLAFNAPHAPLHAPPEDIARYRGKYRQGWDALRRDRYARQLAMGLINPQWSLPPADSESYDWTAAHQEWEDLRMATYAAMVDRMDQNIGRLLHALKDLGIEENTVVLFLSDNGGCAEEPGGRDPTQEPGIVSTHTSVGPAWGAAQNTPFRRYKSWTNEGGISTPLLVRWPGHIKPGTRTSQIGHINDIAATCIEIAATQPLAEFAGQKPAPLEGRSLLPVFRGETRPPPETLFWEWGGNCAVREQQWKLVWDTLNPHHRWQLYDVVADRTENNDLAARHPALVARLSAEYERWAKALGRHLPGVPGKTADN